MVINAATIIEFAALLTACGVIFGIITKIYSWYLKQQKQDYEIEAIKTELKVICNGLHAALDGLEQLGANHSVPVAKDMLEKHLNNEAHN